MKEKILTEMLERAAFDGWNNATLEEAAIASGCQREEAYIAFPEGVTDLLHYYARQCDGEMVRQLRQLPLAEMKIRERIATAVMTRLGIYVPHREAIRQLVGYYALPPHSFQALGNIQETVSLMWYEAGDTSTDFNYYSKRMLLAGVYTSTLLYWLNDNSEDFADTRAFLDRRIANVLSIQTVKYKLKECGEQLANLPFMPRIWGV